MKNTFKFSSKAIAVLATMSITILMFFVACDYNKQLGALTTSDVNITGYLEEYPEQFSQLLKLLNTDVTISNGAIIKYASFLNAYGKYTVFAPTNDAINAYLKVKNISSIEAMTASDVRDLLNIHILQDTISTSKFTDGKLTVPTMYGQYLVTVASYNGNVSRIRVNRQANIIQKDLKFGNGIIHVIDGVLEPAKYTTAQLIENDSRFTIFTEALKKTGYYDTLNTITDPDPYKRRWLSVMAESDSVYIANGIPDYTALKAKYSDTGDPSSATDSLHLYMGYHVLEGLNFVADLVSSASHATLTPNQVITIKVNDTIVVVNEVTINGVTETGVPMDRYKSDNSANNGVVHFMNGNYYIKIRRMIPVYFDLCDYPELKTMAPGGWGVPQPAATYYLTSGQVKGITFSQASANNVSYQVTNSTAPTSNAPRWTYYNNIGVNFRVTSGVKWIKFTTPFIAAGKYKVWVSWRRDGDANTKQLIQTSVDSTDLPILFDPQEYLPGRNPTGGTRTLEEWDNYLQGIGYKRSWQIKGMINASYNVLNCKYVGIITLTSSSNHWIKFTALANGNKTYVDWMDQVHFIPLDADQIWPKFDENGTAYPRPPSPYDDKTAIY